MTQFFFHLDAPELHKLPEVSLKSHTYGKYVVKFLYGQIVIWGFVTRADWNFFITLRNVK